MSFKVVRRRSYVLVPRLCLTNFNFELTSTRKKKKTLIFNCNEIISAYYVLVEMLTYPTDEVTNYYGVNPLN